MNPSAFDRGVLFVRHASVDERYQAICYGRNDVELGDAGKRKSRELVEQLAMQNFDRIIHSDMQRTRFLAERLGSRLGCPTESCETLQERDFGTWEMQPWDAIYARHGDEMLRMISEPDTYRPGGGETTFDLRDRVVNWFSVLPREGITVVVTHGGPIAALIGTQRGLPVSEWARLIPRCGEFVWVENWNVKQVSA